MDMVSLVTISTFAVIQIFSTLIKLACFKTAMNHLAQEK